MTGLLIHLPKAWTSEEVETYKREAKAIAAALGLVTERGESALNADGEKANGNLRELFGVLISGDAIVMMHNYDDPVEMRADAEQIRALAGQAAGNLAITLRGLAAALEEAAARKA